MMALLVSGPRGGPYLDDAGRSTLALGVVPPRFYLAPHFNPPYKFGLDGCIEEELLDDSSHWIAQGLRYTSAIPSYAVRLRFPPAFLVR
jgi:hypothetical protein